MLRRRALMQNSNNSMAIDWKEVAIALMDKNKEIDTIIVPNEVTHVRGYGFANVRAKHIIFPDTVVELGNGVTSGAVDLVDLVISNSVTILGSYACSGCSSLLKADIGTGISSFYDGIFNGCNKLKTIILRATTPYKLATGSVFNSWGAAANVYVPDESLDLYKQTYTAIAGRIRSISDYEEIKSTDGFLFGHRLDSVGEVEAAGCCITGKLEAKAGDRIEFILGSGAVNLGIWGYDANDNGAFITWAAGGGAYSTYDIPSNSNVVSIRMSMNTSNIDNNYIYNSTTNKYLFLGKDAG